MRRFFYLGVILFLYTSVDGVVYILTVGNLGDNTLCHADVAINLRPNFTCMSRHVEVSSKVESTARRTCVLRPERLNLESKSTY